MSSIERENGRPYERILEQEYLLALFYLAREHRWARRMYPEVVHALAYRLHCAQCAVFAYYPATSHSRAFTRFCVASPRLPDVERVLDKLLHVALWEDANGVLRLKQIANAWEENTLNTLQAGATSACMPQVVQAALKEAQRDPVALLKQSRAHTA